MYEQADFLDPVLDFRVAFCVVTRCHIHNLLNGKCVYTVPVY